MTKLLALELCAVVPSVRDQVFRVSLVTGEHNIGLCSSVECGAVHIAISSINRMSAVTWYNTCLVDVCPVLCAWCDTLFRWWTLGELDWIN